MILNTKIYRRSNSSDIFEYISNSGPVQAFHAPKYELSVCAPLTFQHFFKEKTVHVPFQSHSPLVFSLRQALIKRHESLMQNERFLLAYLPSTKNLNDLHKSCE